MDNERWEPAPTCCSAIVFVSLLFHGIIITYVGRVGGCMIITIDGPVASGKSTVALALARDFSCYYLYTGLLYRTLGYVLVQEKGYDEIALIQPREEDIHSVFNVNDLTYHYNSDHGARVVFKGVELTPLLKRSEIDRASSVVSADPLVRQVVLEFQRILAQQHDLIADGRDCGTVVFPQAEHKFFLTADQKERARRWQKDQAKLGRVLSFEECLRAVIDRDRRDTTRTHSPLLIPQGAHVIDCTHLTFEETVNRFKQHIPR
jgi:CMP/dCMP kinase